MPLKKTKHSIANSVNQTQSETVQNVFAALSECVKATGGLSVYGRVGGCAEMSLKLAQLKI